MSFSHNILANISLWTALLWVGAGCGGNNGATLTVTPGGPVVVQRAATQQFTANRNDVKKPQTGEQP